jgi:hypothetical protein
MLTHLAMSALLLLSGSSLADASPIALENKAGLSSIPAVVEAAVVEVVDAQEKIAALAASKVSGRRQARSAPIISVPLTGTGTQVCCCPHFPS